MPNDRLRQIIQVRTTRLGAWRVCLVVVLGVLMFIVFAFMSEGRAAALSQDDVSDVLLETNLARIEHDESVLRLNPELTEAAILKAADMIREDYWAHRSPSGLDAWYWIDRVGYQFVAAGENLARGYDDAGEVVEGWLNSPSHRENLLNSSFEDIGLAIIHGKLGGEQTTLIVAIYSEPTSSFAATERRLEYQRALLGAFVVVAMIILGSYIVKRQWAYAKYY